MATTDLERLIVSLEASTVKYERALNKAQGVTNSRMRQIESRTQRMGAAVTASMGRAFALLGGAAVLRGTQNLIDASTRIENSLKVAGLAGDELTKVYDRLFASAQRNAAPLEALTELYGRAALVQKELGVSTEELLGFTDNIAVALRVSGKSAAESSGALLQLSQALGSGTVRAEEFNSILEGALPVAQAAAAGLDEAGGSVAKLRQLVVDGKVSSEAFFRAFEAGSVILTEKVANAELTISQGFTRLQNVLIDTAGKFDEAAGASSTTASALNDMAEATAELGRQMIENKGAIQGFLGVLQGDYLDAIRQFRQDIGLADLVDPIIGATAQVRQSAEEVEASIQRVITAASGVADTQAIDGLIERLEAGDITAEELQKALIDLGGTSINFAAINDIAGLIGQLRAARGEAQALASTLATPRGPQGRGGKRGSGPAAPAAPAVATVSLTDYAPPSGGSGGGGSGGGGGGGGGSKQSPADRFAEALAQQERQNAALVRETALRATLNPLVNDYGMAMERLRVQQELENEAIEAGLTLTPERQAAIEQLATGYANATVEAERLAEAQEYAQQTMADFSDLAKDSLRGFIDDMREGKSATEALGNAMNNIGNKLLDMGLNLLFGGGPGGGNILGALFGGGFASGTANTGGARGQIRGVVHGQEAVIPLPSGGKVPVQLKMPDLPGAGGRQALTVHVSLDDSMLRAVVKDEAGRTVAAAAPQIVGTAVKQSQGVVLPTVARHQQQSAGSDYRMG